VTDEFIRAASFGGENMSVKPSDSIVFFNFRKDRMRQISALFRKEFPDTEISSFTEYEINNGIPKAFSLEGVENPLAKILADRGKSQLRVAESEKSAHVTYFFDAEREDPFPREFRVIIPSKKVASHDKYPEMMAEEITTRIISALEEGSYDFILANYANADMVAHTGNFDATVKAVEILDKQIGLIADTCLKTGATLILTSDHGNAEKLIDSHTGEKDTKHNSSPVPVIVIDKRFERIRTPEEIEDNEKLTVGSLCDIAPTVLELMGIEKPAEMTGQSIIPYLQ
jgi:2,3-bisphosphoglycerate-independent phosphoglycerate mutase